VVGIKSVGSLLKGGGSRSNHFIMRFAQPLDPYFFESGVLCMNNSVREDFNFG